jgi:hypothetical protein
MTRTNSHRTVRLASAAAICLTLAFGTAGVAMAGQRSSHDHSSSVVHHDRSSFGRHDDGQASNEARGVVTGLGANTITLQDRHGNATTYTTTSATTYFEGRTAGTAAELAANEEVSLELTSTSPQTVTKVEIHLVRFAGPVTAVAGNTITIGGRHGTTFNVLVGSATTYTSGGAASTFAAVVVGAVIDAVGIPDTTPGTLDANSVNIWAPRVQTHVSGVVSSLGTNTITLKDRHGTTTENTTSSTTTYFEGKTGTTVAALAANEEVSLELTSTSPQTVTKVEIHLVRLAGPVTAIAGDAITIGGRHGLTFNVVVGTGTTYTSGGAASTFAAVVVGAVICAVGLPDATPGTLDASAVAILPSSGHHDGFGHDHAEGGSSHGHSQGGGPRFGRGHGRH